ncbi:MAG: hypothetical protein HY370_04465 [Proteobacteria bacterium]|nr:hypothetical protein [Pseudomonadota bacterium]
MKKFIVEGRSENSMEEALADAMSRASVHMAEGRDVNIAVLELGMAPGRGYKAVLEVTVVPMGDGRGSKPVEQDVELKRMRDRRFPEQLRYEAQHVKQMVQDHFTTIAGDAPEVSDYYLKDLNEAGLLNQIIEKEFLHATQGRGVHEKTGPSGRKPLPDE